MQFDENGALAEAGGIDYTLLNALNEIEFYSREYPKSLGREWINKNFWHIVREFDDLSVEDRMKTLVMHIAIQVRKAVESVSEKPLIKPLWMQSILHFKKIQPYCFNPQRRGIIQIYLLRIL